MVGMFRKKKGPNIPREKEVMPDSDVYGPSSHYRSSKMNRNLPSRYDRNYYMYEDPHEDTHYGYEYGDHVMDDTNEMFEYIPEERSMYLEVDDSYDESATDWHDEMNYLPEHSSDYRYQQHGRTPLKSGKQRPSPGIEAIAPGKTMHHRRSFRPDTAQRGKQKQDLEEERKERMPYQQDVGVYLARGPVGHKAFRANDPILEEEDTYDSSDMYSEESEEEGFNRRTEYEAYPAHIGEETANAFKQDITNNGREKVVSVTEYDKNNQMLSHKNKQSEKISKNSMVYIPVMIVDKDKNKVHDKQIDTNKEVYISTNTGQNVLEQAHYSSEKDNHIALQVNNQPTTVYPILSSSFFARSGSKSDAQVKMTKSKMGISKSSSGVSPTISDIQIKKSPSKTGGLFQIKSQTKSLTKKSSGGIGKYESIYGLHRKMSFFDPTLQEQNFGLTNTLKAERDGNDVESTFSRNPSNVQSVNKTPSVLKKPTTLTAEPSMKKPISLAESPTKNLESELMFSENLETKSKVLDGQGTLNRLSSEAGNTNGGSKKDSVVKKKSSTHEGSKKKNSIHEGRQSLVRDKSINEKHSEHKVQTLKSISEIEKSESKLINPKKKSMINPFKRNKSSQPKNESTVSPPPPIIRYEDKDQSHNYDSTSKSSDTDKLKSAKMKRDKKLMHGKHSQSKAIATNVIKKDSEITLTKGYYRFVKWMFSESPFVYMFQIAQFFLGISMHSTLMEVLRNFKPNHQK